MSELAFLRFLKGKKEMTRLFSDRDLKTALRLLERLANPRGDWRDDEARRKARKLLKKLKRHEENRKDKP